MGLDDNEVPCEQEAIDMWRISNLLLAAPIQHLAINLDTLVDTYHNLEDIIRLANMGKHEEIIE